MTNERDELAKAVFVADNYNATDDVTLSDWEALVASDGDGSYAHRIAQGLMQAGYRKPQQVTTAVELAALPRFTVIRSAEGAVFERQTMWHEAGSRDLKYWTDIALPVTVLQLGWGEE